VMSEAARRLRLRPPTQHGHNGEAEGAPGSGRARANLAAQAGDLQRLCRLRFDLGGHGHGSW
jgi:hypothetical protein